MVFPGAYCEAYPRAGDVAVLCEGDLIGYEAGLLRRWVDAAIGTTPLVDVWPCGTSTAVFGFCDAIGRSRPLLVIEDRDFRDKKEALKDCEGLEKDRRQRELRVLGWRTWARNEIENYLLQPEVLFPVMADAFDCEQDDVQAELARVIPALALYEATQYTLYNARKIWGDVRFATNLIPGVDAWPRWNDGERELVSVDAAKVRGKLEENFTKVPGSLNKKVNKWSRLSLLEMFDSIYTAWRNVTWEDREWLTDWSGKEVLQSLRICLTARFGWHDLESAGRVPLRWEGLRKEQRDAQDRPVEAALRPLLVSGFVDYVTRLEAGDILDEFAEIQNLLNQWKAA